MKYVDRTLMGKLKARTQKRKQPLFSHNIWNKYQLILDGAMKTNNVVEGYNHSFGLSLPNRASEWNLICRRPPLKLSFRQRWESWVVMPMPPGHTRGRWRPTCWRIWWASNFSNITTKAYMESLVTFFDNWSYTIVPVTLENCYLHLLCNIYLYG